MRWAIYTRANGQVRSIQTGGDGQAHESLTIGVISVDDDMDSQPDSLVVINDTLVAKVAMPVAVTAHDVAADGTAEVTITVPLSPTTVTIFGPLNTPATIVDDGELILTFDIPGEYAVALECFPYLSEMVVINAT